MLESAITIKVSSASEDFVECNHYHHRDDEDDDDGFAVTN